MEGILSSPIHVYNTIFFQAILKLRFGGRFLQWRSWEALLWEFLCFLLSGCSSCSVFMSLQEKGILGILTCERWEKEGKRMSRHLILSSFLIFVFKPFSFYFLLDNGFSNVRIIMANRMGAHFCGLGQWHVWLTHFTHYSSTLTRFRVYFNWAVRFFLTDLVLLSSDVSVRHLQLSFRRWFGIIYIRVTYPLYLYKFNPCVYRSNAIHISRSRFR